MIPNKFYYNQTRSESHYGWLPTGDFDLYRMIKGQPCWIEPSSRREPQPKSLILVDWRSKNWSKEDRETIGQALQRLIKAGFPVYIWQNGELKRVDDNNLYFSLEEASRTRILTFPQEVIEAAAQQKISRDQIQQLDAYDLQCLLNEDYTLLHSLSVSDFVKINEGKEAKKVLQIIQNAIPPLKYIIHDVFSETANLKVKFLEKRLPLCETKKAYHEIAPSFSQINDLVRNQVLEVNGASFQFDELKNIKTISLQNEQANNFVLANVQTFFQAVTNLKTLNLEYYENLPDLSSSKLETLETLSLNGSTISSEALQALLKAVPNLKTLKLGLRSNLPADLSLARQSWPTLEELELNGSSLNSQGLQQFLQAAPNLKILDLENCTKLAEGLQLSNLNQLALERLNLKNSSIHAASLQHLLQASPKLKALNLANCNGLAEAFTLTPGCLPELETLNLSGQIDEKIIHKIIKAAPNLKTIHLERSSSFGNFAVEPLSELKVLNLSDSITIDLNSTLKTTPKLKTLNLMGCKKLRGLENQNEFYLPALEMLNVSRTRINSASLQTLLRAAPKLRILELANCSDFQGHLSLERQSLPELKRLNLMDSSINLTDLQNLLNATPKLEKLTLRHCSKLSKGLLSLEYQSLPNLEALDLSSSSITMANLQAFLQAAPKLKTLHLKECDNLAEGVLRLDPKIQLELKKVNLLNSNINATNLSVFLQATPQLKKLNLQYCYGLSDGSFSLETGGLPALTELNLDDSTITATGLQAILKGTPKLKTLSLQYCKNLSDDLSLMPQSLADLEELNLVGSEISANTLKTLLQAAPNLKSLELNISNQKITPEIKTLLAKIPSLSQGYTQSTYQGSNTELINSSHDPTAYRYNKPTPPDFIFQFSGTNKTKNQGMIIEKLSQYLQLTQQHLTMIPKLQKGICNALTHFWNDLADFPEFLARVSNWDGTKANLTDPLKKGFEQLYRYVQNYNLKPNRCHSQFLGANFPLVLQDMPVSTSCILVNPWHAIAVRRKAFDSWEVYDPNSVVGAKVVNRNDLQTIIETSLGRLVSIESSQSRLKPKLTNPDNFIEEGGLLTLCYSDNRALLLSQLQSVRSFTQKALDGLLLRDVKGTPAWTLGLNHPDEAVVTFTQSVLMQFIQANPVDYQQQLQQSLEVLTGIERLALCSKLLQIAQGPLQENLFELVRGAPVNRDDYTNKLQTWRKAQPMSQTLPEYCQRILRAESCSNHLIEVHSSQALDGMVYALSEHCKHTSCPVFYIDKPEDLVCSSPFMRRQEDNRGELCRGPGGWLYDFLQAHKHSSKSVLLVNYEFFNADEMVLFNHLLEKKRCIDGVELPETMLVVGLINLAKPDCYQGSDFYSRWDKKEICPISESALSQQKPLAVTTAPVEGNKFTINLYSAPDWQSRLLGRWRLNGHSFTYEEGQLRKAIDSGLPIEIQNGLWEDKEFHRFWQRLKRGGFFYADRHYFLPEDTRLSRQEGYNWAALGDFLTLEPGLSSEVHPVLNLATLSDFFEGYDCNRADKTLEPKPGLIEAAQKAGFLAVNVPHSLTAEAWAMVLDACKRYNVRLIAHGALGVSLPEALSASQPSVGEAAILSPWEPTQQLLPTQVIISDDADTTVASLTETTKDWEVIDISECKPYDLLFRFHTEFNQHTLAFAFTPLDCAVPNALNANKKVILKGHFSPELRDALSLVVLQRQRENKAAKGQLVIVSETEEPFAYASALVAHKVSAREKIAHLGAVSSAIVQQLEPYMDEPLSKLRARCEFLQRNPQGSCDEAWKGMLDLAEGVVLPSEEITAEAFLTARLQAVNAVLDQSPYVFLTGLSGVGKSTFVEQVLGQNDDVLYLSEAKILEWAKADGNGRKILFLDEANLSARQWTEFEGLFHTPPGLLIEGIFYPLSPEHKVVFAGNPVSYGDERQLASLFQRHGRAVLFTPLAPAVIKDKVLMPILQGLAESEEVMDHILACYRFICNCSTQEVLLSPRELQMMALLTLNRLQQSPTADAKTVIQQVAYQITQPLVPKKHRQAFANQFAPHEAQPLNAQKVVDLNGYLLTPSRQVLHQQLLERLQLREWRYEHADSCNEEQKYGGLGGVIIEGNPGIGKSELVLATLLSRGYQEERDLTKPTTKTKPFYRMPASMAISDKKKLLLKAFDEGAVVIVDEINSSPMMEQWLNALLMGKNTANERPKHPGFMVIGTQNPISMAGRRIASTALQCRLTTLELADYQPEEMKEILIKKGCSPIKADLLVKTYTEQLAQAKAQGLNPEPCFRDVLTIVEQEKGREDLVPFELPWRKVWRQSEQYQEKKRGFEKIWRNPNYKTDEDRVIALLEEYTQSNRSFGRFFTIKRSHVAEINALCASYRQQKLTVQELMDKMVQIKLINKQGSLATILDFLKGKGVGLSQNNQSSPAYTPRH